MKRLLVAVGSAVVLLAGVLYTTGTPIQGIFASHGYGGAACPTDLTITASPRLITWGDPTRLSGTLSGESGADVEGATIYLRRQIIGGDTVGTAEVSTNANGNYALSFWAPQSARHFAVYPGDDTCPSETSGTVFVGVRVQITIERSHTNPRAGATWYIRGSVRPNHAGTVVMFDVRRAGSTTVRTYADTLNSDSRYVREFTSQARGAVYFIRARWEAQDDDHARNATPWVPVQIG